MGKSSRKNKNDRINIIRKQYDAFLEEDKKRRERNEYILGKLDKMRSSAALVPVSNATYNTDINLSEAYLRRNNQVKTSTIYNNYVSYSERPKMPLDILNKNIDESTILKEISKKYILIPKRISLLDNENIYRKNVVDDQDWKSKYNILDVLKSEEKDGESSEIQHKNEQFTMSHKDTVAYNDQSINIQLESDNPNRVNEPLREETEKEENKNRRFGIPEINSKNIHINSIPLQTSKMLSEGEFRVDRKAELVSHTDTNNYAISPEYKQNLEHVTEKEKLNSDLNEKNELYLQENVKDHLQMNESSTKQPSGFQDNIYQSNKKVMDKTCANRVQEHNTSIENFVKEAPEVISQEKVITESPTSNENLDHDKTLEYRKEIPEMKNFAQNEEIESNNLKNVIEPNQTFKETSHNYEIDQEVVPVVKTASNERTESHDDISNSLEGQNIQSNESTHNTSQGYEKTLKDNPVMRENNEQSEYENHDSEINAFEAEQNEMFYPEQTGEDTYAYNQEDGKAEEYTADGFQQNDQYYYEGVQQEQAYATNINEHEEATEQYDPHYNQQYEGSYDNQQPEGTVNYENVETYGQHQYQEGSYENPQYDNVVNYENQQDNAGFYQQDNVNNELQGNYVSENEIYEQQLYGEPENQEHIEDQLIAEEGYVVNSQINDEEMKGESIVENESMINNTSPSANAASIPDTKVV